MESNNNPAERLSDAVSVEPYTCYHCKGVLGLYHSTKLFIGAAIFIRSITIECGYCHRHTFWKPRDEKFDKNNGHNK